MNVVAESETRSGAFVDNEDRYLALYDPPLYAVLDGEGQRGRAADVAVARLRALAPSLAATLQLGPERVQGALTAAVRDANQTIFDEAQAGRLRGCGTTLTCFTLTAESMVVAHVGDSRLYCREPDGFRCVTVDHSLVEDARLNGASRAALEEIVRNHGTVILRALGIAPEIEVDTYVVPRRGISAALLCTDGLWRPFDPRLTRAAPPDLTGRALLDKLFEAYESYGENDNATGLLVSLEAHSLPGLAPAEEGC